jgi:hypothetical protein
LNEMIADVLEKFGIYLHQLTPNAIVRLSELHYQTKAREDGLHENFGCYNFAYRKDAKSPVISYRTKWLAGWKTEWFYVKVDEKKEKLVQSPLELIFGEIRPRCDMKPKSPCQVALGKFRVIAEHIGTRGLVQEFLAFRVFPTLKEWDMPKLKGEKKEKKLVRLPYYYKFKKHFKEPCQEWLDMIEVMCNEILGNYSKKEDQLMTAAFGTRPKRRLNLVMDALNFGYPDYERLDRGAEGQKRKRVASVLDKEAAKLVKKDEETLKKRKLSPEPKITASNKRKAAALKQKTTDIEDEARSTPPIADVEEILKVTTESLTVKLSPLGPHLTKLFQKEKEPSVAKKPDEPKKRRIIHVVEVIEQTPPLASASKTPAIESTAAVVAAPTEAKSVEAETAEDVNLEATLSEIDTMLLDVAAEEAAAAAEEIPSTVAGKGKEKAEDISEEEDFNFQDILGQALSKAKKEELKEYAISCGYRPGELLFGGVNEESLGCLRDHTRAKVVGTLSKSVGLSKVEADLSRHRRQHIDGSLFYANFKVKFLTFYCFDMKIVF